MKMRNGFVSNSSSSSFIIKKSNKYPDAYSLASKMVYYRKYENDDKLANQIKVVERKRKLSNLNKENVKFNCKNVTFNSCNYDTYIIDYNNYLIVETCNNHDWSDFYDKSICSEKLPNEFKENFIEHIKEKGYFKDDDFKDDDNIVFYWDEIYGLDKFFNFYKLEYDKVIKNISGYDTCKKCDNYYIEIDGIVQCPFCGSKKE